jgi:3-phenylpropionate/cinnamic acid dioxygenase small subunit
MGLEDQIRSTADELEIRNLLAHLAHMADAGELDEYIQLFTEDAVWGGGGQPQRKGHGEILEGARARRASGLSGPGSHTLHVLTTSAIRLEGENATSRSVFHYYTNTDATPALLIIGIYEDSFRRTAAGWKLSGRVIHGPAATPPAK